MKGRRIEFFNSGVCTFRKPTIWVIQGKIFERLSHSTGHWLDWQNTLTGNVLLTRRVVDKAEGRFDPAFDSGGEDRDFFRRIIDGSFRLVWYQEAPVRKTITQYR